MGAWLELAEVLSLPETPPPQALLGTCTECGGRFWKRSPQHTACTDVCRERRRARVRSPERTRRVRSKNREWAKKNRKSKIPKVWLRGAPPYEKTLPGGITPLYLPAKVIINIRTIRLLHGALTRITGEDHDPLHNGWALIPHGDHQWGVYWWREGMARVVAGRNVQLAIGDNQVDARFGPLWKVKSPIVSTRGHRRLRIDAITPVCCRSMGGTNLRTAPSVRSFTTTLQECLAAKLGVEEQDAADLRVAIIESSTEPRTVVLGGKYRPIRGWVGHCVVDTNAVGEWLFRVCAAGCGLGGRTAFGMGRINV